MPHNGQYGQYALQVRDQDSQLTGSSGYTTFYLHIGRFLKLQQATRCLNCNGWDVREALEEEMTELAHENLWGVQECQIIQHKIFLKENTTGRVTESPRGCYKHWDTVPKVMLGKGVVEHSCRKYLLCTSVLTWGQWMPIFWVGPLLHMQRVLERLGWDRYLTWLDLS